MTDHAFAQIPEISLSTCSPQDVVRALHEVGFFVLVDHGVDQGLIDGYFSALKAFFALPQDTKALMAKSASRHFRGWEGIGAELTNNRVDYREQIDLSTEHPARQPDVIPAYLRLDGPNQWLPEDVLPGFRSIVMDYFAALGALDAESTALDPPAILRAGIRVTAQVPTIIAAHCRLRAGLPVVPPDPSLNHAANFLYMLSGERPSAAAAKVMDVDMVLHAEHGSNASSFAARVVASTG